MIFPISGFFNSLLVDVCDGNLRKQFYILWVVLANLHVCWLICCTERKIKKTVEILIIDINNKLVIHFYIKLHDRMYSCVSGLPTFPFENGYKSIVKMYPRTLIAWIDRTVIVFLSVKPWWGEEERCWFARVCNHV